MKYLGHIVENSTIRVDLDKVAAVQQFLGLANYYHEFIKNFAKLAAPLSDLYSPRTTWRWGEHEQSAFDTLK